MRSSLDDLRMIEPQCHSLQPVVTMHENNWFSVKSRGGYYVIEYNVPSVTILPIVDHHSIIMVNAKRPVIADSPSNSFISPILILSLLPSNIKAPAPHFLLLVVHPVPVA